MEDPWANAWGEPSKPSRPESSTLAITSTWAAPSVSVIQGDHEDDLSTPSWSVRPTTEWNEPDIPETSLWGGDTSAAGWNPAPSSFDRMPLASKESDANTEPSSAAETAEETHESPLSSSPSSLTNDEPQLARSPRHQSPEIPAFSPSPRVPPLSLAPPEDLDGFGTFETGLEVEDAEDWVSPSRPTFSLPSSDAWASEPWGASASATEGTKDDRGDDLDDAWEAARQQKVKQDLHVPPELLVSILRRFEELSSDLWPVEKSSEGGSEDKLRNVDFESTGLQSALARLAPDDLVLPPNIPFSKTFTSKELSEALRLTRHSICTRASPIAFYIASKGSTSWEAAVKAKTIVGQEDLTPAGWKIIESAKDEIIVTDDVKNKPNGGLLSFFQRKATLPALDDSRRPGSPVNVPAVPSIKTSASPRASFDSTRSSTTQSQTAGRSTPSSPNVASFGSIRNPQNDIAAKPPVPTTVTDFSADAIIRVPTPPAASAVSRFLGRFSGRSRSSSRDSMALSSDDLEFLADVPTAPAGDVDDGPCLNALSMMVKSPLPTKLPSPLAPPPRAPQHTRKNSQPLQPSKHPAENDDFMSFFDSLPDAPNGAPAPQSPLSLLTAGPTPPVKPDLAQVSPLPAARTPSSFTAQNPPAPTIAVTSSDQTLDQISRRVTDSEGQPWASFDYPGMPANKPTSTQTKRPFVAVMSSTRPPSTTSTPPLLPKPLSAFSIPPPPSSQRPSSSNNAVSGPTGVSPFPPPPSSRSHTPRHAQPMQPQPPPSIDDGDDFADFLSSPSQPTHPASPLKSFGSAMTPISAPPVHSTFTTTHLSGSFGDFLDPIPPQPPAKSTAFGSSPPPPSSFSPKPSKATPVPQDNPTTPTRKISRKADHSRTLSLLETAAARGRWFAPPSPLPEALPPPSSHNGKAADVVFMGGGSMQQEQATSFLAASFSSPVLGSNGSKEAAWTFPPPSFNATALQPAPMSQATHPSFSGYSTPKQRPLLQSSPMQDGKEMTSSSGTKTGGLSAQDLSFFEGL